MPNISQKNSNQTMKFSKLIEHNKIFFFRNHAENVAGRLFLDLFSFLEKLYLR